MSADTPKRRPLGRGLSALLGERATAPPGPGGPPGPAEAGPGGPPGGAAPEDGARAGSRTVPIERLRAGRNQPRRHFDADSMAALVESVKAQGVVQPILVRADPGGGDGFEIVAGERRWRAAQAAGLHTVPVVVRTLTDRDALEIALVENVQRQDLSALEEGEGYRRLIDEFGHTQEVLAKAVGKSRSHVANTLRLLNLPDSVRRLLQDGRLSAGHARALLNADDPAALAQIVVKRALNVRQTEQLVATGIARTGARAARPAAGGEADADIRALERDLAERLGLKATVEHQGKGGRLVLHYRTLEQLDDLLQILRR